MNASKISICLTMVSAPLVHAATVTVDSGVANSVQFQDYRTAPGSTSFNNAQLQGADGGGTTVYESVTSGSDPQITHGGGSLDLNTFGNFRTRYSVTGGGGANSVNAWRNPAAGGQSVTFGDGASGLTEFQGTIPNPASGVTGFRLDPVGGGTGWSIELDYMFIDRGRTIGFEFDHDGDELGLGYNGPIASKSVTGGSLLGTAAAGGGAASDTNISFAPFMSQIDTSIYKYMEITMAGHSGDRIDLFYSNTITGGATKFEFESSSDGNTHTYLIDFTGDAAWEGASLDLLRLDPTVSSGATFSIDSVRFYETAVVPEPSTALLLSLAGLGLLRRRR